MASWSSAGQDGGDEPAVPKGWPGWCAKCRARWCRTRWWWLLREAVRFYRGA